MENKFKHQIIKIENQIGGKNDLTTVIASFKPIVKRKNFEFSSSIFNIIKKYVTDDIKISKVFYSDGYDAGMYFKGKDGGSISLLNLESYDGGSGFSPASWSRTSHSYINACLSEENFNSFKKEICECLKENGIGNFIVSEENGNVLDTADNWSIEKKGNNVEIYWFQTSFNTLYNGNNNLDKDAYGIVAYARNSVVVNSESVTETKWDYKLQGVNDKNIHCEVSIPKNSFDIWTERKNKTQLKVICGNNTELIADKRIFFHCKENGVDVAWGLSDLKDFANCLNRKFVIDLSVNKEKNDVKNTPHR